MPRFRPGELLLIAVFAACVAFQLFVPPAIGLANNGDFAKMTGRFALAPETHDASGEYRYFNTRWFYDRSYSWVSDDRSSELLPISAAMLIGWAFSTQVFDIRILGAIHALLWIACFAALVPLLRPLPARMRVAVSIAALFLFTDVYCIAYCNSFYTDTAAFLFLAWAIVLWLHLARRAAPSPGLFALFVAAAALCVLSKTQHAPIALWLCALAAIAAFAFPGWRRKAAALALASVIALAALLTFRWMPESEKWPAQYAVIFMSILHRSPAPLQDARELGLGPEYLRYVDYWPAQPADDPLANPDWRAEFTRRTGHRKIAAFYLRHPLRALAISYRALHERGELRPALGNYDRQYGLPPGKRTRSFGWWSALRTTLDRIAPWYLLVWYAALLAMSIRFAIRHRACPLFPMGAFAVLLTCIGLTELAVSTLADAGETERHLFLFHVVTDFTFVLGFAWAAWMVQGRASLRANS